MSVISRIHIETANNTMLEVIQDWLCWG